MRCLLLALSINLTLICNFCLAEPLIPVRTRSANEFKESVRKNVDALWSESSSRVGKKDQVGEYNSSECQVFREYVGSLLRKLIQRSQLEEQTKDLYLFVNCYNLNKDPLGAKMQSRTLVINQGYLGGLKKEDALAAVLAHELSHHILRHEDLLYSPREKFLERSGSSQDVFGFESSSEGTLASISDFLAGGLKKKLLKLIGQTEDEADVNSVAILANAGYSFTGALELLDLTEEKTFIPSSVNFEERRRLIVSEASRLGLMPKTQRGFPKEVKDAIRTYFRSNVVEFYEEGTRRTKVFPDSQVSAACDAALSGDRKK